MAFLCLLCAPLAAAVDERLAGLLAVRFQCGTNNFDLVSGFADAIENFHYRGDALKLPQHYVWAPVPGVDASELAALRLGERVRWVSDTGWRPPGTQQQQRTGRFIEDLRSQRQSSRLGGPPQHGIVIQYDDTGERREETEMALLSVRRPTPGSTVVKRNAARDGPPVEWIHACDKLAITIEMPTGHG